MDQFANKPNVKRLHNLLETSRDEAERRTIRRMLAAEEDEQALGASEPSKTAC
jgi:hypothetical protein